MSEPRLHRLLVEHAKEKAPEERDLLQTLVALDVPVDQALTLVTDETSQAIKSTLASYAFLIRESRMSQFPEGSEVHRRLGMIADMLDPSGEDTWEYG